MLVIGKKAVLLLIPTFMLLIKNNFSMNASNKSTFKKYIFYKSFAIKTNSRCCLRAPIPKHFSQTLFRRVIYSITLNFLTVLI